MPPGASFLTMISTQASTLSRQYSQPLNEARRKRAAISLFLASLSQSSRTKMPSSGIAVPSLLESMMFSSSILWPALSTWYSSL